MGKFKWLVALSIFLSITLKCTYALESYKSFYDVTTFRHAINVENGRLMYVECEEEKKPHEKRKEMNCTVVMEKLTDYPDQKSCGVSFQTDQQDGHIGEYMRIIPFGRDKAVVLWRDEGSVNFDKLKTIQFDGCRVTETKIERDHDRGDFPLKIKTYDETYDVLIQNQQLCGENLCWMVVGADGRIVKEPSAFMKLTRGKFGWNEYLVLFDRHSMNDVEVGHFIVYYDYHFEITHFHLKKFYEFHPQKLLSSRTIPTHLFSTAHNKMGVGIEHTKKNNYTDIELLQFDAQGQLLLNITLSNLLIEKCDPSMRLPYGIMHNLKEKGFLLLHKTSFSCTTLFTPQLVTSSTYEVFKVEADGRQVGNLDLLFKCQHGFYIHGYDFYENEKGDYCLAHLCAEKENDTQATIQEYVEIICFNDTDIFNS